MRAGEQIVFLEPLKVLGRIVEPVGVIDPQPVDLALGQQPQDQAVCGLEDLLALHAQGGQVVDVEEAAVVDLVGRDPPVGQAIALMLEQVVQQVEAVRVAGLAVEQRDVSLDELACALAARPRAPPAGA